MLRYGNWRGWYRYGLHSSQCTTKCGCWWRWCVESQLSRHPVSGRRWRGLTHRRTEVKTLRRQGRHTSLYRTHGRRMVAGKTFGRLQSRRHRRDWSEGFRRRNGSKLLRLLWEIGFLFCQTEGRAGADRRLCWLAKHWSEISLRRQSWLKRHDGLQLLGGGPWHCTRCLACDWLRLGRRCSCKRSTYWRICCRRKRRLSAGQIQNCSTGT